MLFVVIVGRLAFRCGLAVALFVTLAAIAAAIILPRLHKSIYSGAIAGFATSSAELLALARRAIADTPWLGSGVGTYRLLVPTYQHFGSAPALLAALHRDLDRYRMGETGALYPCRFRGSALCLRLSRRRQARTRRFFPVRSGRRRVGDAWRSLLRFQPADHHRPDRCRDDGRARPIAERGPNQRPQMKLGRRGRRSWPTTGSHSASEYEPSGKARATKA